MRGAPRGRSDGAVAECGAGDTLGLQSSGGRIRRLNGRPGSMSSRRSGSGGAADARRGSRPARGTKTERIEMRIARLMPLIALSLVALAACPSPQVRKNPEKYAGLDKRLDAFSYIEEGKLLGIAVGTQATRYRENEEYIPLAVGIANKTAPTLTIDRESFLLYDETGKQYPLAPYSEISERYKRAPSDREFISFFEIWNAKWPTFRFVSSAFFPVQTASVVRDFVELPKFHYTMDYLYFPRPEGDLLGHRFELHMAAKGLDEPVFVKFLID